MNASTSAGDGGRPVMSRLTRRMSVSRDASGEGRMLSFSRRARTNASIGFRTDASPLTRGTSGRTGLMNDQCVPPEAGAVAPLFAEELTVKAAKHARNAKNLTRFAESIAGIQ